MNSKVFLGDYIRCLASVGWDINPYGKTCTRCGRWRRAIQYDKNKSKKDGFESHCKPCVSTRKEMGRLTRQRLRRRCEEFESVIVGGPDSKTLERFADIFGAALKEVLDDDQTEATHTR